MPHPTRSWCLQLGTLITLTFSVARASDAQSRGSGRVEGTVMDSLHARPLAGVKVLALDARSRADVPRTAISGSIDSLPAGRYMVAFESPMLDSLEIELPPREADVVEGGVAMVDLAVPSASRLRAAVCPGTILPPGTGAILGHVVSAETEGSLAGVVIAMTWREVDVDRKTLRPVKRERTASVTTDADGWYLACGVPLGTWLSMQLLHEGRNGPVIRTAVGEAPGVAIRHLSLSASASRLTADSGATGANGGGDVPLSGSAMLSGVVRGLGVGRLRVIGLLAGIVCYLSSVHMKKIFRYDDALDAFGVHGVGGALGAMLTGVFASNAINALGKGWLYDGNAGQMLIQFYDVAGVFVYCAIATYIILKVIDMIVGLRVKRDVEVEGLDINLHGETIHA